MFEFNVNQTVYVKLTDKGRRILRENHVKRLGRYPLRYEEPKVDAEGYTRFQLWVLMQEFGPHMRLGLDPFFEATIKMDPKS